MGGRRYDTYATLNVRFFALDSNKVDEKELAWLENALRSAPEAWKIGYFHHPHYSDGDTHGSSVDVRLLFEPLFLNRASTSSLPATTTFTSASLRRRAFITSSKGREAS